MKEFFKSVLILVLFATVLHLVYGKPKNIAPSEQEHNCQYRIKAEQHDPHCDSISKEYYKLKYLRLVQMETPKVDYFPDHSEIKEGQ